MLQRLEIFQNSFNHADGIFGPITGSESAVVHHHKLRYIILFYILCHSNNQGSCLENESHSYRCYNRRWNQSDGCEKSWHALQRTFRMYGRWTCLHLGMLIYNYWIWKHVFLNIKYICVFKSSMYSLFESFAFF